MDKRHWAASGKTSIASSTMLGEVTAAGVAAVSEVVQTTDANDETAVGDAVREAIAAGERVSRLTRWRRPSRPHPRPLLRSERSERRSDRRSSGLRGKGIEATMAIAYGRRGAVVEASQVGADLTSAAVGECGGRIEVANDAALSAEDAAAAAATGAVEAAGEISKAAAVRVRRAVEGTIQGVRVAVRTATGRASDEDNPDSVGGS